MQYRHVKNLLIGTLTVSMLAGTISGCGSSSSTSDNSASASSSSSVSSSSEAEPNTEPAQTPLTDDPDPEPEEETDYAAQGAKYLENMDYDNAILCFEKAIKADAKNAKAYAGLYVVYMAQGKDKNAANVVKDMQSSDTSEKDFLKEALSYAETILKKGTDTEKKNALKAVNAIGDMALESKDYEFAEKAYKQTLAYDSINTGALSGLYLLYRQQGNTTALNEIIAQIKAAGYEVQETTAEDGSLSVLIYDPNGNVVQKISADADGKQITREEYTYDETGAIVSVTQYNGSDNVYLSTVRTDNVTTIKDGQGRTVYLITREEKYLISQLNAESGILVKEGYVTFSFEIDNDSVTPKYANYYTPSETGYYLRSRLELDSEGHLIKKIIYNETGEVEKEENLDGNEYFHFDTDGLCTESYYKVQDGTFAGEYVYQKYCLTRNSDYAYDCEIQKRYTSEEVLRFVVTNTRDYDGNLTNRVGNGTLTDGTTYKFSMEYDGDGAVLRSDYIEKYNESGCLEYTSLIRYNENGIKQSSIKYVYNLESSGLYCDYVDEIYYDDKGIPVEERIETTYKGYDQTDHANKNITYNKYDKNGNITEKIITRYDDNSLVSNIRSTYSYDSEGSKISADTLTISTLYSYDDKGNLLKKQVNQSKGEGDGKIYVNIKWEEYNTDNTVSAYGEYLYNSDGSNNEKVEYRADGKVTKYTKYQYDQDGAFTGITVITYKYNDDGNVSKEYVLQYDQNYTYAGEEDHYYTYSVDGKVTKDTNYQYDSNYESTGITVTTYQYDENENVSMENVYEYDQNINYKGGISKGYTYDDSGDIDTTSIFVINDKGQTVQGDVFDTDNNTIAHIEYFYDEDGNCSYAIQDAYEYDENQTIVSHIKEKYDASGNLLETLAVEDDNVQEQPDTDDISNTEDVENSTNEKESAESSNEAQSDIVTDSSAQVDVKDTTTGTMDIYGNDSDSETIKETAASDDTVVSDGSVTVEATVSADESSSVDETAPSEESAVEAAE